MWCGRETIVERLPDLHLVRGAILTQTGMEIASDAKAWERLQQMSYREFGREWLRLTRHVKFSRIRKTGSVPSELNPAQCSRGPAE